MDRRSLIFSVVLANSITLKPIPITALPNEEQPNAKSKSNQNQSNRNQNRPTDGSETTIVITQQGPTSPEKESPKADPKHPFDFWEWARTSNPTDILSLVPTIILLVYAAKTLRGMQSQI